MKNQLEVSILFHELKRCKYCFVQEHFFFWRYCTGAVTKKKNVYLIMLILAFLRTLGQQSRVNKETVDCH